MKRLLILLLLMPRLVCAETFFKDNGFHWYGVEPEKKETPLPQNEKNQVKSHYETLMQLRAEAKESLARAILEPGVENTADYMRRQQAFLKANQKFLRNWEKALLLYPELDYRLNHPTDNNAIALKNEELARYMNQVIKASSREFGFILFYRGNSEVSNKFIQTLTGFNRAYQIQMIAVSTDGRKNPLLPDSRLIPETQVEQKMGIKGRYEPAVFLVHLKTGKIKPLSYGFMAYEGFKRRMFDVVTNFKRFTEEGVQL